MNLNKKILLGIAIGISCYSTSFAIFGFGDLVHDPINYGVNTRELTEQTNQGIEMGRQTVNQLKQIEQMHQSYEQFKLQIQSWRYDPIRNMTDVSRKMDSILNAGKSLHQVGQGSSQLIAEISGDPDLATQSYFDTISAGLGALDEQNKLFKSDAQAYDNLKRRMDTDVSGGTSAVGALANLGEATLNHIDDLNQKMANMLTNDASKAIKEEVERDQQEKDMSNIRKAFKNATLPKDGNWDWTKFKPIYTSNHQEQI
jgi:hypothetical protein